MPRKPGDFSRRRESISSDILVPGPVAAGEKGPSGARLFVDRAAITVSGGKGGDGAKSFRREKYVPFGGPDGGNGGDGGSVWLEASERMTSLLDFKYRPDFKAPDGSRGLSASRTGARGDDLVVAAPAGTVVFKNGEFFADLVTNGCRVKVVSGGRGGRGNKSFKTRFDTAPRVYEKGQPPETARLQLELKLIADIGLVGPPNAGKSSLLARLTSARPKIAPYPFTTLSPNLGAASWRSKNFIIADIPGLIEGASAGKGLGLDFLRHIERTKILLYVIDGSGMSGDPTGCYRSLLSEIGAYSEALLKKPSAIVFNKTDIPSSRGNLAAFGKSQRRAGKKIFPVSAASGEGLETLLDECAAMLAAAPDSALRSAPGPEAVKKFIYKKPFEVTRGRGVWIVSGKYIEDLALMTDFAVEENLMRFGRIIKKLGVEKALLDAGARTGDTVRIASKDFDFLP